MKSILYILITILTAVITPNIRGESGDTEPTVNSCPKPRLISYEMIPCKACEATGQHLHICSDCKGEKYKPCSCSLAPKFRRSPRRGWYVCPSCGGNYHKNKCSRCDPYRYIRCNKCNPACKTCSGQGSIQCPTCEGRGYCPAIDRETKTTINKRCTQCNGARWLKCLKCTNKTPGYLKCGRCKNTGVVATPCLTCHKSGKVAQPIKAGLIPKTECRLCPRTGILIGAYKPGKEYLTPSQVQASLKYNKKIVRKYIHGIFYLPIKTLDTNKQKLQLYPNHNIFELVIEAVPTSHVVFVSGCLYIKSTIYNEEAAKPFVHYKYRFKPDFIQFLKPLGADVFYHRGYDKYYDQDYSGAIADYTRAIEIDPNYALAYHHRGMAKHVLKDYSGAISDYTRAIEISPNYARAYSGRGLAKRNLQDYSGAISDYTRAIEINPNYSSAYINRGMTKYALKDYSGAISDYTKAIEIDPNAAWAYNNRGDARSDLKDYSGAISDYTRAIEINPNYSSAYNGRGNAKYYLKDYLGAISDYTRAIEIDPNYASASPYYNRGLAKKNLQDYSGALADFTKVIEMTAPGSGNSDAELAQKAQEKKREMERKLKIK